MNSKKFAEYGELRKTSEFKRFLFWLDKIVEMEGKVKKASEKLTANLSSEELNNLQPNGNRMFEVDGEAVENYIAEVTKYCNAHDNLFLRLERLEQKYPMIFLTKDSLDRKMGLIQQKELYLKIIGDFIPKEQKPIQ